MMFFSDNAFFVFAEYVLTMPNMYARGILFGKMVIELGDTCTVRNGAQDLHADIEFKTKGFFSGTYNALAGRVKHGPTELGEVMGKWSALMEFKTAKVRLLTLDHLRPPLFTLTSISSCLPCLHIPCAPRRHPSTFTFTLSFFVSG